MLEKKRASVTADQVDSWFVLLEKVIKENNLENRPGQVFNADDSSEKLMVKLYNHFDMHPFNLGLSDSVSYSKVLVHRSTANAYSIQGGSGRRNYTSVMFSSSATGSLLPPFTIYKAKRMFQDWCIGGPEEAGFSCTEK